MQEQAVLSSQRSASHAFINTTLPQVAFACQTDPHQCDLLLRLHGKNGFVTATKLGTTNKIFVDATKNFAAATKRFVDRTKHFVVTKYFCYPYFNK